jgi:hypothetical protein
MQYYGYLRRNPNSLPDSDHSSAEILMPKPENEMRCPRCESSRIQRDFDDANIVLRAIRVHKLLCNNCGLVFKGLDRRGKLRRAPTKDDAARNRRRGARYSAHLPATISLIEGNAQGGPASYSRPSAGHCEAISKFGMGLSLVGTHFGEEELSRVGRLLLVRLDLPEGSIEVVVTIVTCDRVGTERKRKWFLGVKLLQISEADTARLAAYLEKRAQAEPLVI